MGQFLGQMQGGGAQAPGAMGAPQSGAQPQAQPQTQFGPESLMSILTSIFHGGAGQAGPEAGNASAVGGGSLMHLLPLIMQMFQPPKPVGMLPGQRGTPEQGGPMQKPGGGGSNVNPQQGPAGSAAGMLGQLGLV